MSVEYFNPPCGDTFWPARNLHRGDDGAPVVFRTPEDCADWVRSLGDQAVMALAEHQHRDTIGPVSVDVRFELGWHDAAVVHVSCELTRPVSKRTEKVQTVMVDGVEYARTVVVDVECQPVAVQVSREIWFSRESFSFYEPQNPVSSPEDAEVSDEEVRRV